MERDRSLPAAFREAGSNEIDAAVVEACLVAGDRFEQVWRHGLESTTPEARRGALCVEIGLIAEAAATLLLQEVGLDVFGELARSGAHGVDLLALTPGGQALAIEVKGTLRGNGRPRLGRSRLQQMSIEWLSNRANPLMGEWEIDGSDVYGALMHLNFAAMSWRIVLTHDHRTWLPVREAAELHDLTALEREQ